MPISVRNILQDIWDVIKKTAINWNNAGPWRQGAILAYYSIFSLPALLLIIIVFAGYFFGEDAVSKELSAQISTLTGTETARAVEIMVANASETGSSRIAIIIGLGLLLFGATSLFYHLQLSLNRIWGVIPKPKQAFVKYIKDRLLSFGLVLLIGFLLLLSFVVTSLLAALGDWLKTHWPEVTTSLLYFSNYLISLLVTTTLFTLMFKILPDAVIRWRAVWFGGLITAILFAIGQYGLSMYFSMADPASIYGAAGAIILILIWAFYVALILLFGAEFTHQWANKFGHGIKPKGSAVLLEDSDEMSSEIPE